MPEYRIVVRIDPSGVASGRRAVEQDLNSIGNSANAMRNAIAQAFGGIAIAAGVRSLGREAFAFRNALAEISTQIDETVFDMRQIEQAALDMARAFGTSPTEQAAAQYEIISAGAKNGAEAIKTLDAANRLAIGGLTSTAQAADLLTSVLNAYGTRAGSATDITDALFIAVRNGKTRVEELAVTLGRVAPLAAQLGVSFDELVGSTAALTQAGISTAEAVTGVRSILSAVAQPSQEAREQAKLLGLQFDVTALQAKGFQGFINDVIDKTKGNSEAMAVLFGRVEALNSMLAFAGEAGKAFGGTMDDLAGKAGATQRAFEIMMGSPGRQVDLLMAAVQVKAIELSTTLISALGPALAFIRENIDTLSKLLVVGIAAWLAYKLALAGVGFLTAIRGLIALEAALGATTTAAALSSIALKGLQAVMMSLLGPVGLITLGVMAIGLAWIYFSNAAAEANSVLASLSATATQGQSTLAALEREAAAAGLSVDATGTAANTANPLIMGIESAYRMAAAAARQLASDARMAAIAVAQGEITQLQSKRAVLAGPLNEGAWNLPKALGLGDTAGPGLKQYGAQLFGGPSVAERRAGMSDIDRQIATQNEIIARQRQLFSAGVPVGGPPTAATTGGNVPIYRPGGDDEKKKRKGGAQKTFDDIVDRLKQEKELLGLVGTAREIRAAQLDAETALDRKLSDAESGTVAGLVRENESLKDTNYWRDQVRKPLEDEIETLGLVGVERDVRAAQLQIENDLQRKLTETEAAYIDTKTRTVRLLEQESDAFDQIAGPIHDYSEGVETINRLLAKERITADEARRSLRDLRIEYLQTQTDMESGLELGKLEVGKDLENVGARAASAYKSEWDDANQSALQLEARFAALQRLMIDDPIHSGMYAQRLRELAVEALNLSIQMGDASFFDTLKAGMWSLVSDFEGILPGLTEAWGSFFQQLQDGFANAVGRAIVYSEDLGSALLDVARSAVSSLISALVKLGIQWLISQTIGTAAQAAVATTSAAAGAAVAAAWAPAAAAVSLATFGANAVPATTAIATTYGLAQLLSSVSALGGFDTGGYTGDRDGVAGFVHGREFVINAEQTARHRALLETINAGRLGSRRAANDQGGAQRSGGRGGISIGSLNVTVQGKADDPEETGRAVQRGVEKAMRSIARDTIRGEGRDGGMLSDGALAA